MLTQLTVSNFAVRLMVQSLEGAAAGYTRTETEYLAAFLTCARTAMGAYTEQVDAALRAHRLGTRAARKDRALTVEQRAAEIAALDAERDEAIETVTDALGATAVRLVLPAKVLAFVRAEWLAETEDVVGERGAIETRPRRFSGNATVLGALAEIDLALENATVATADEASVRPVTTATEDRIVARPAGSD